MAVITESAIRELASIRGERMPITSCYLDVDGRRVARYPDLEHEVDLLLRDAKVRANGDQAVHDDLRRIGRYVRGGIDRSRTRGVAIFACRDLDLWTVIELPVPVHHQVVINHVPAVGQLEAVLRENEPIGVLLADRQQAQMYVFALGELVEHSERFDALPRDEGTRGQLDRGGDHPHHLEARVQQHLRNAAKVAFEVWQQHPFAHLVIGAPDAVNGELSTYLHPYLSERLASQRISVSAGAGHDQVLAAAQAVEAAGAFSLVLECIPSELAREVSAALDIPTIGIGAGAACDGQVLVYHDLLGIEERIAPRFVRRYAELGKASREAIATFAADVREGRFPAPEESFEDPGFPSVSTPPLERLYGG